MIMRLQHYWTHAGPRGERCDGGRDLRLVNAMCFTERHLDIDVSSLITYLTCNISDAA